MNFKEGIFDIDEESVEIIKRIYKGKIIKCLVAPYHSYKELDDIVPKTDNTYLFPERDMSFMESIEFVHNLVESDINEDVIIITSSQEIILDMIGHHNIRCLTKNGDIVVEKDKTKTLMANIHDIHLGYLKNHKHGDDKDCHKGLSRKVVEYVIDFISENEGNTVSDEDYEDLKFKINLIGEELISNQIIRSHLPKLNN